MATATGEAPSYLALRLSSFYIAIFMVIGCLLPFWPVWLKSRGMSGIEIGILTAIPILGKMIFSPLFASLGDRRGERKKLMLFFITVSFIFFSSFHWGNSFTVLLLISILYGMSWAPIMSFGDNITLLSTRATTLQYGRLRLWGSLSFIAMAYGFGSLLDLFGEDIIYSAILLSIALTFISVLFLPDVKVSPLDRSSRPLRTLLSQKPFVVFLFTVACIHGSHALYYAFATIHWRSLGYSDTLIGFFWAEAVLAEVIFFIFGAFLSSRFAPSILLFLAAVGCLIRWSILALNPDLPVLVITQTLHALTFGAMHLGAMSYLKSAVSLDLSASAQSLYGAAAFGVGAGVTLLFVGFFYEKFGAEAYFIMTLISLGGTISSLALRKTDHIRIQAR